MTESRPTQLSLLSPAKLNLFLHITGQRSDGYHNLQTLFQLLDYGDQLDFHLRYDGEITLSPALEGVAFDDNLIIKAARALKGFNTGKTPAQRNLGVDISLTKLLPMGGGIGGGSSNAATTLVALNYLWQSGLNLAQLQSLGLSLGADVPVFINAQTAWAEGVGEVLQPIELTEKWFLVLQPDCHVSTASVFSHKDLTRDTPAIKVAAFLEQGGRNDCQALVRRLYPPVDAALSWLEQHTSTARMTGTGACVFAEFATAKAAKALLEQAPLAGFVAKGVNQSPLYNLLPSHG